MSSATNTVLLWRYCLMITKAVFPWMHEAASATERSRHHLLGLFCLCKCFSHWYSEKGFETEPGENSLWKKRRGWVNPHRLLNIETVKLKVSWATDSTSTIPCFWAGEIVLCSSTPCSQPYKFSRFLCHRKRAWWNNWGLKGLLEVFWSRFLYRTRPA